MDIAAPSLVPDLRECALLLDVDGTLLDLAPTPREVFVPSSLRLTVTRLSQSSGGAVALVSGRSLADLDSLFAPLELPAVGGHGAELRRRAGAEPEIRWKRFDATLRRELARLAEIGSGVLIEDKGYSIALHYRLAPERETAVRKAVADICAAHPSAPIEVLPGKSVIEIKPKGFSKASGVRDLMQRAPFRGRHPIFIGDDVTDESVFGIISEYDGLAFSVGRAVAGVNGHFDKPEAVRDWLSHIAGSGESVAQ